MIDSKASFERIFAVGGLISISAIVSADYFEKRLLIELQLRHDLLLPLLLLRLLRPRLPRGLQHPGGPRGLL